MLFDLFIIHLGQEDYMRKLGIYLNDNQFQKLQILLGEEEEEKIEKFLNETIYEVINCKWIEHKENQIASLMEQGLEEETVRFILNDIEYDIFSGDGDAVISEDDGDSVVVKLVEDRLYFYYENGNLIACSNDTEERFKKALRHAGIELKNHSVEEIDGTVFE